MKSTIPELPGLVRMAAEHGVGEIFFLPLYQYEDLDLRDEAIYWDEREEIHAAVAETQALADRLGVVLSNPPSVSVKPPSRLRLWFQDLDPPRRDRPLCEQPWSIMRVSPNGAIHPCDGWFVDGVMGNWATQSWEEIWNGPAYTRLRRAHWRRAQPFECCKVCSGYAPNRYKEMRPHPHALDTADLIGRGWFTGIELAKSSRRNRTDGKEPGGNGR
jgi:radical SAM protein with 4Fe4S-binding SPASM domain